jgi:enterobacterial common antigen flippase
MRDAIIKEIRMIKMLTGLKHTLDLRSGVTATVQTLLVNILILGTNVCTGIISARILAPDGRGMLAAMILWPQFLATLLALGLPYALLYNLKRRPEEANTLVGAALFIGGVMGIVAALSGVLLIPRWLNQYPLEAIRFAQLAMLLAPVGLVGAVLNTVMQAQNEFTLYNRIRYLPPLLTLISLALLAVTHHLNPFTAALAYLLTGLPINLWTISWVWRRYRPTLRAFATARRHLLSYSMRSWGQDSLGIMASHIDRVLVVGFVEPATMGLYVVALSLSQTLNVTASAVVQVLFPKASGRPKERVVALAGHAARVSFVVTILMAVGLVLLGPQAIKLLYSEDFAAATAVFRLLVGAVVIRGTAQILAQALMALDRPGVWTILQAVETGLIISLLTWLVPRYGLEGAGMALLISALVLLILVCASFPTVLKVRPPRLWMRPGEVNSYLKMSREWLQR